MRMVLVGGALLAPLLASADATETASRLDALYAKRYEPAQLKELESLTAEALESYPNDGEILWRAARLKQWQCDGATNNDARRSLGKAAWDYAERAVHLVPQAVAPHYYAAIGLGCYAQAVGIFEAITQGLEGRFNQRLDQALKLDPAYDHAGPLIAKGRYYFELPWPKRDLRRSAEMLEKAVMLRPTSLRAYLYLAETQLRDGAPRKARETLNRVIEGGDSYDIAEGRRVKGWVPRLKAEIDKELK
jgi:hypothetical protein